MYALKESVEVEFEVKSDEKSPPRRKTRARGTTGRTNKPVASSSASAPAESKRETASKSAPSVRVASKTSEKVKKEPKKEDQVVAETKEVTHRQQEKKVEGSSSAPPPNRLRSAANPSKRYNASRAMQIKQELPWNYDLTLADRDLLTMERDARIASDKAAREHLEKKQGERTVNGGHGGVVSSRVRSVKSMSGTALNGQDRTIFAMVHQRQKDTINKTVSRSSRCSEAQANGGDHVTSPPMEILDKYRVNRLDTGIHSKPWNNSETSSRKMDQELRLVPQRNSRLVPMQASDMHIDVGYKNISALNASESVVEGTTDNYGKKRVSSRSQITRLIEGSLSELDGY